MKCPSSISRGTRTLDPEERGAEDHRDHDEEHDLRALAGLRGVHRQRHRQRAEDEHRGIDGAGQNGDFAAGQGERIRVPAAIDHVGHQRAAEEQDLGEEEHPHAEDRRLGLLLEALEVMRERRMVLLLVGDCRSVRQRDPPRESDIRRLPRSPPA